MAAVLGLALMAAACGRPVVTAPAGQATSGAVNPYAHVTAYACAGGEAVTAGYPDSRTAIVDYRGHAYALKLASSADGARYTGMGLQWWTKGAGRGSLAALKPGEDVASAPGLDCVAAGDPDPPAPRTI